MLGERVRQFRNEKGMSQAQLADRLHVVRQTVSKWEKGTSVPDAEMLLRLARALDVPAARLLDLPPDPAAEQARARLAELRRQAERTRQAGRVRGGILALTLWAAALAAVIQRPLVSALLALGCGLAVTAVLWRHMGLLTGAEEDGPGRRALRGAVGLSAAVLAACGLFVMLRAAGVLPVTEPGEKWFAAGLVMALMLFAGGRASRLPFNRHVGLRLPWTVLDRETWDLAHRVLGAVSLPTALLYAVCTATVPDFQAVTLAAFCAWIGIPGAVSWRFFRRKTRGR